MGSEASSGVKVIVRSPAPGTLKLVALHWSPWAWGSIHGQATTSLSQRSRQPHSSSTPPEDFIAGAAPLTHRHRIRAFRKPNGLRTCVGRCAWLRALSMHGHPGEVITDLAPVLAKVIVDLVPLRCTTPASTRTTVLNPTTADASPGSVPCVDARRTARQPSSFRATRSSRTYAVTLRARHRRRTDTPAGRLIRRAQANNLKRDHQVAALTSAVTEERDSAVLPAAADVGAIPPTRLTAQDARDMAPARRGGLAQAEASHLSGPKTS